MVYIRLNCNKCNDTFVQIDDDNLFTLCYKCNNKNTIRIKDIESFIKKIVYKYNFEHFDFSEAVYVNNKTSITFTCTIHNNKMKKLQDNLRDKHPCKYCTADKNDTAFKNKVAATFDKNNISYTSNTCSTCNDDFKQIVDGNPFETCNKCTSYKSNKKKDTYMFIKEFVHRHNTDNFSFQNTEYTGSKNAITVYCNIHNIDISKNANAFTYAHNPCAQCGANVDHTIYILKSINKIKDMYPDQFDYDNYKIDSVNNRTHIVLQCLICGKTSNKPTNDYIRSDKSVCTICNIRVHDYYSFKDESIKIFDSLFIYDDLHNKLLPFNYRFVKYKMTCKNCDFNFEKTIANHIFNKQGCPNCSLNASTFPKEWWIKQFNNHHFNIYDYSQVTQDFIKYRDIITVTCPKHNRTWNVVASSHLKKGCRKCGYENNCLKHNDFINKCKEKHGGKYDYSLVEYTKGSDIINIICPDHGVFQQKASYHKYYGCMQCSIDASCVKPEEFLARCVEVHGKYKYNLDQINYTGMQNKIIVICNIHGEFNPRASDFVNGSNCKKCADIAQSSTKEEFIEKAKLIHGEKYDYSLVKYINNKTNVIIICKNHGKYKQLPFNHICYKNGCPFCINKSEYKLYKILKDNYKDLKVLYQFKVEWCRNKSYLPFDFLIKENNIIIELDGPQHFIQISNWQTPEKTQQIDKYKTDQANKNNYSVIRIYQPDLWLDTFNWLNELKNAIDYITQEDKICNFYITKNKDIYHNYTANDNYYIML